MNFKLRISQLVDMKADSFIDINDKIWEYAEIKYSEHRSAKLQCDLLESEGFTVEKNLAGISTAFVGSFGEGSPVIALLGEFDALSGLSQEADATEKKPLIPGGTGHGCGHNTLGSAVLSSAIAIKDYMIEKHFKGTIRYYGCPAEEGGAGKTFMVREGCFANVDLALTWHPAPINMIWRSSSLANVRVLFDFKGISSHAAVAPELGRSALDAVELMDIGANYLREHVIDEARIHYAITNTGGDSPNVVQSEAQVFYAIRAPKLPQVNEIYDRVKKVAEGASLMTETKVEWRLVAGYSNYLPNKTLSDLLCNNMKEVLPTIKYTDSELDYANNFITTLPEKSIKETNTQSIFEGIYSKPIKMSGSTDVADVSWVTPTAQFTLTCYAMGTPSHSWQQVAQGKSSIAHKGLIAASKIIAMTAIEIFENPNMLEQVRKDYLEDLEGEEYICPIPKNIKPNYSIEKFIKSADNSLYKAKHENRNRVVVSEIAK
jgi:aminobenzoyl-glutamate utilization protein B